jgi:signal transduction histidine kinase
MLDASQTSSFEGLQSAFQRSDLHRETGGANPNNMKEGNEAIYSQSRFMLQLLNDILDVSAIESGTQRLYLQPTDVRSFVEESIALCQPLAPRNSMHIEANNIR